MLCPSLTFLVVREGVEKVVVARVQARVNHATGHTKHGTTSVLDLNVKGAVTGYGVCDLVREGVSSWNGSGGSIITTGEVLGSTSVLTSWHGGCFGKTGKGQNLNQTSTRDVGKSGETHAITQDFREWVVSIKIERSVEKEAAISTRFLENHSNKGEHGDTAVLDLDGTTAGKGCLVGNEAKGVPKVQGTRVNTKSIR